MKPVVHISTKLSLCSATANVLKELCVCYKNLAHFLLFYPKFTELRDCAGRLARGSRLHCGFSPENPDSKLWLYVRHFKRNSIMLTELRLWLQRSRTVTLVKHRPDRESVNFDRGMNCFLAPSYSSNGTKIARFPSW